MLITRIKGIGEKNQQLLGRLGIFQVEDLLEYYPRTYDIFEEPALIKDITQPGTYAVYGEVSGSVDVVKRGSLQIVSTTVKDYNADRIKISWFNMPFLKTTLKRGFRFVFRGRIVFKQGVLMMEHPALYKPAEYEQKLRNTPMQPVYRLTAGDQ